MSKGRDLELALQLQAQFDGEAVREIAEKEGCPTTMSTRQDTGRASSQQKEPMSIVDEQWELLDPNPDMRAMFLEFNDKYFWGRLAGVEVRWSPRMTLCAGLCCYEGHGGLCSIRLSSPLLKLRPRKDLVETLLHEMIHAYLFVTANNKDHDGHGPEFCKHMNRLNQSTGTNITVYHNFHDEVDVYRQHWWRCDGPCQKRPPYYGMVRRAMNRAPSKRDPWWAEHQRSCGGSYTKVKEPEGYGVKKGTKRKKVDADEDGSENETKKRATDSTSSFPGKGSAIGGTSTTSRLIPPKTATLDNFLRKVENPNKPPVSTQPSSTASPRSPARDEEGGCQGNQSKNARLRTLAAIFESDDSEDEDIVIVKIEKPLKKNLTGLSRDNTSDSDSKAGTSQSNCHRHSSPSNSPPMEHVAITKPKQINQSDTVSKNASSSQANRQDGGKKQDSIIDAFSRMRQRSGDCRDKEGEKVRKSGASVQPSHRHHTESSTSNSSTSATNTGVSNENGIRSDTEMVACPVCQSKVEQSKINQHLDQCLS